MAFTDPQSITIDGVTTSLPRTNSGGNRSEYRSADGSLTLSAASTYGKRTRQVIRVDHKKVTADPFIDSQNRSVSMSCYIVFDRPDVGYTNDDALDIFVGLEALVDASSKAAITKLLGGES